MGKVHTSPQSQHLSASKILAVAENTYLLNQPLVCHLRRAPHLQSSRRLRTWWFLLEQLHHSQPTPPHCLQPVLPTEEDTTCPHLKGQLKRYLISLPRISSHFWSSRFWRRAVLFV